MRNPFATNNIAFRMATDYYTDETFPNQSSDEDSLVQESFYLRDHDYDMAKHTTGKLTSIRSLDLIREYLEWCQVEPKRIPVPWDIFKVNLLVKCDEIQKISQDFIAHRLGVISKEQTALFNNLELKEVVLAMIKKKSIKRAFKSFI